MNKEIIFSMNTAFRGEFNIHGYSYGRGDKAACIVGSMRGNEYQQLYMCSLLAQRLAEIEAQGDVVAGKEILLIPTLNYSSMNAEKKKWISDDSDINRSFPGNIEGTATSRIAATLMDRVKDYTYGIQFASFYLQGISIPHVRMMETGTESTSLANLFGMPYVLTGDTRSFDTATLNYNWQKTGTQAFSVYSATTDTLDGESAKMAVSAVLRFLTRMGIIRYESHGQIIRTDERKKRPRRSFRHIGNKCYRGARHRRAGYPRCHRKNRRRGRRASRQHFSDSRYCLIVVSSKFRHCK